MKEKKHLDWVSVLGIGVSVAGLFWWQADSMKKQAARQRVLQEQRAAAEATAQVSPSPGTAATPAASPSTATAPVETTPAAPEQLADLVDPRGFLNLQFTSRGGGIKIASLPKHAGTNGPVRLNRDSALPIGNFSQATGGNPAQDYTLRKIDNGILFERVETTGLKVAKTFNWPQQPERKNEYCIDLELALTNAGTADLTVPGYFLELGAAEPLHVTDQLLYEEFDWSKNGKIIKINTGWFDAGRFLGFQYRDARENYVESGDNIKWASTKNQFYITILFPTDGVGDKVWARRITANVEGFNGEMKKMQALEGALGMPSLTAKPGETIRKQFRIYMGPKEYSRLKELGHDAQSVLNFRPFEPVSVFLLNAMNVINSWVGNYAAAIIILTILIKLGLWPLQAKSMRSMKEMSALTPKVQELREKYADDPTRMNQEVMQLYKTYGVNPLAGCLPLLVQIPIFFGFYAMLGTAVELRNSSFLWVRDLTQPDTIFRIGSFPVNLLPLVMAATMVWQMNLTPKTGDQMQQRIFMFMPLIFIFFCYNYASALPLYWTVQNLFSIVQIYLTRDKPVPPLTKKTVEQPPGRPAKGKGKRR